MQVKTNLGSGVFFLLASAALWISVPSQIKTIETRIINAQTFPRLVIAIIFFCSLFLCVKDLVGILARKGVETAEFLLKPELRVLAMAALIMAFAVFLPYAGYLLDSAFLCLGMLAFYNVKNRKYYLIVLASCFLTSYFYKDFLLIKLP